MDIRISGSRADGCNSNSGGRPLALRRICGVCRHFTGHNIRDIGGCAHFGYGEVPGTISAGDCDIWERHTVAPGETKVTRPTLPGGLTTTKVKVPRKPPQRNPNAVPLADRLLQYPLLAKEGLTLPQAAERLGVGRATIVRDLGERGLRWTVLRDGDKAAPAATLDDVVRAVSQVWGLDVAQLLGRGGDGVGNARAVAYALSQDLTGLSSSRIGEFYAGRHGKTILAGADRARDKLFEKYADRVRRVRDLIAAQYLKGAA